MRFTCLLVAFFLFSVAAAQNNVHFTSAELTQVVDRNYNAASYASTQAMTDPHQIAQDIQNSVNADSLHAYLVRLSEFETRNSGSDTVSDTRGMGAARRWAKNRFDQISQDNENRLVVGYLEWERNVCGMPVHRNVVGILPGMEAGDSATEDPGLVIIEGHLDSRCGDGCDIDCVAEGMEDNGSGSALVIELARVMSRYQFNRTIIFMLTTAEEQGLVGAEALARYCDNNDIEVAAVLNNDVIGGVICGETSSPPSCPSENDVDSTQVRLFSFGTVYSQNKQLARYIKLQYQEELVQHVSVPMQLTIMTAEDRTGRGGDHIPFRQHGFAAMRFTSANEHGDGNPSQAGYHDRQHTSEDILGVDTDNDNVIDSFFVDFNYLARNACINGAAATMIAQNVCSDLDFEVVQTDWKTLEVSIQTTTCAGPAYRIALRTETNDWDTVLTTADSVTAFDIPPGYTYWVSVAQQNSDGVESLFTREEMIDVVGVDETREENHGIKLLQNRPNPFDETTAIAFVVYDMPRDPLATIRIQDVNGKVIQEMRTEVRHGPNELVYDHGYGQLGTYFYSLIIDGQVIDTKKMVFVAN